MRKTKDGEPYIAQRRSLPPAPKLSIDVSAETIKNSVRKDSRSCMIADSIKLSVPGATYPMADIQTIRFTKDGYRFTYLTPRTVQWKLIQYDQGEEEIEPFRFQLRTGTTTRAGGRAAAKNKQPYQARTPAQHEATEKAMAASPKGFRADGEQPKRKRVRRESPAKLVLGPGTATSGIPQIRGGRVPPVAPLAGGPGISAVIPKSAQRQYGLRAMDRMK